MKKEIKCQCGKVCKIGEWADGKKDYYCPDCDITFYIKDGEYIITS